MQLAGATVLRGVAGFGHSSHIPHRQDSPPLPDCRIVEIVDSREKIDAFLPCFDGMMGSGLVTLEKVQVLHTAKGEQTGRAGMTLGSERPARLCPAAPGSWRGRLTAAAVNSSTNSRNARNP